AERVDGRGLLVGRDAAQLGKVPRGRQQVVHQRAGQQLAVLIIDEVLQEDAAEALHQRTDYLALQRQRIDDAAYVLDRDVVENLDPPGLGIDRHMGRMRAIRIGVLLVEERTLGRDAGEI